MTGLFQSLAGRVRLGVTALVGGLRCARRLSVAVLLVAVGWPAYASDFDPAFDANIRRFGAGRAVAVQSDGKVVVGGFFSATDGMATAGNLARYNPDGSVDAAFRTANGTGANGGIYAVAVHADGKIYLAGEFTTFNGVTRNRVARLNADGSLDPTFDPGTGPNGGVITLAVQSDGKVIVGGVFTSVAGTTRNRIARLNANGTPDTAFNPGSGANGNVWDIALDSSGRAVVVGSFTTFNGTTRNRIARLTTAGALDTSIAFTGGADADVYAVALDASGLFYLGGNFSNYNGTARKYVARLTTAGAVDSTFTMGGGFSGDYVTDVQLDSAGRLVVAGRFSAFDGYSGPNSEGLPGFVRLTATGARDTTFLFPTSEAYENHSGLGPQAVAVTTGDVVYVAGYFFDEGLGRGGLTRVMVNGLRDQAFNPGAGLLQQAFVDVRLSSNGRFYLIGLFDFAGGAARSNVARFQANGTLDASFRLNGYFQEAGFNNSVSELVELPDGALWVFGPFTRYAGVEVEGAVRFNANGSIEFDFPSANELRVQGGFVRRARLDGNGRMVLAGTFTGVSDVARPGVARVTLGTGNALLPDATFNAGSGPAGGAVWDFDFDATGRLLVAGDFTAFSGTTETGLVRLAATGALDTTFAGNTSFNGGLYAVSVLGSGQMLVGGQFTSSGGFTVNRIDRLNADGTSDANFNPGTGANGFVRKVIADRSGRPVFVGGFSGVRDEARGSLARLGANGAADAIFAADQVQPLGNAYGLVELPDGKLLVAGGFSAINGTPRFGVARFHSAAVRRGALAASLDGAALANGEVRGVLPLPDGKFLLTGDFTTVSGVSSARVAKVDANGVVDPAFNVGAGANGVVNGALLQPDGKIVLFGAFTTYNNAIATFLVRLNADGTRDTGYVPATPSGEVRTALRLDDGRLLLAGNFATLGGTPVGRIARLNVDGTRDATFAAGAGADGMVFALVRATDGSLFLGGAFLNFDGAAAPGLVKLTANGARASGHTIGTGVSAATQPIRALNLQADGRLVVGGEFATFGGVATGPLVRLNADGTRDTTFLPAGVADGAVFALTRLAMGHLAVAGTFTTLGGGAYRGFAVLDDAGRINPVFDAGTGFNNAPLALAQAADGRLAVGGNFTTVNGTARNRFALLFASYDAAPVAGGELGTFEVNPGTETILTSGTTSSAFSYQWFKDGVRLPGATSPTYTIAAAGLNDAGVYTTRISNGAGETFTAGTRIIVKLAPVLTTAPVAQAVGYGAGATFTVAVAGPGPFTYQWYRNGELIPGATANSYSLANVGPADFGATFTVRITNSYGTTETTAVALTFNPAAVPGSLSAGFTVTPALNSAPNVVVRASDGKFYVGGSGYLRRLNADGSQDTSFVPALNTSPTVRALALQADGKVIITGSFTPTGGASSSIARLNADGSRDTTFAPSIFFRRLSTFETTSSDLTALAIQADGKILVGGDFSKIGTVDRWYLARLNADGSVDTGFVTNSVLDANGNVTSRNGPDAPVRQIYLQGTAIVIAGEFTLYKTSTVNRLARLSAANAVDGTFAGGTRANGAITSLAVQPDGKLVLGGAFTAYNGTARNRVLRVNADGSLDATFNPGDGPTFPNPDLGTPNVSGVAVLPDGGIVVTGLWRTFSGWPSLGAVRLLASGAIDHQWAPPQPDPRFGVDSISGVLALPDGRVLVRLGGLARLEGGAFPPEPPSFLSQPQVLSTGNYAPGQPFILSALATGPGTMTYQWFKNDQPVPGATTGTLVLRSLRAADAGTYYLRATSSTTGSVNSQATTLNVAPEETGPGARDYTWSFDGGVGTLLDAVRAADGAYFVLGRDENTYERGLIYKFDAEGRRVTSYLTGSGFDYLPSQLVIQADGKLIAGGYFTSFGGTARNNLARLNADGTLDTAYNPNPSDANGGDVYALALQSNGNLVVGGNFTTIAGTARNKIARLTTTGAIDTTFVPGAHGLTRVQSIRIATDGKIYVLGYGSTSGTTDLLRLNANGSLDAAFARLSASSIADFALDSVGRLIVVGSFTTIGGQPLRGVARVSSTGVVEANFGPVRSDGSESGITRVIVGSDGYTYLSTSFGAYDQVSSWGTQRLDANGKLDVNFRSEARLTGIPMVSGQLVGLGGRGLVRVTLGEISPVTAPVLVYSTGDRTTTEGNQLWHQALFTGSSTMTYVWRKNGVIIPGAASAQLQLGTLSNADAGTYTLTATNSAGSATATMVLTMLPPDPLSPVSGINLSSGVGGSVQRLLRLADGRVIGGGNLYSINGTTARGVFRLNADGTPDTAFLSALPFTSSATVSDVQALPDGKLLVLGNLPLTNGTTAYLVRLATTGALDAALLTSTTISAAPQAMKLQPDGRVIVAGNFTTILGVTRSGIARLNANGTLDSTYATGGAVLQYVRALDLDAEGRLYAFGGITSVGGQAVNGFGVRLTTTGALDATYAPALTRAPDGLFRTATGRLLVYGYNDIARIGGASAMIAEILPDGSFNPAFLHLQRTESMIEDQHGRLYALNEAGLSRLLPGGGIDRSVPTSAALLGGSGSALLAVGSSGSMTLNNVTVPGLTYFNPGPLETTLSVAISPPALTTANEGALVVYRGDFRGSQGATLQWLKNGTPIPGATTTALFLGNVTPADTATYTLRATRGAETVTTSPAVLQVVAQTGRAGEVDLAWGAGLQLTNVTGATSDAQGRVYLRGFSMLVNSSTPRVLVGLDAQGAVRTDFSVSPRLTGNAGSVLPLADGRLLVGGYSSDLLLDGSPVSLVRLTATGDIDPTFTVGVGRSNGSVIGVASVQPLADGRLLVVGGFSTFNNQTTSYAVRLSADGVLDPSFTGNFGGAQFFAPAPDGKWWLAGSVFTGSPASAITQRYLLRLNADGTLDESYRTIPRYSDFSIFATPSGDGGLYLVTRLGSEGTQNAHLRRMLPTGEFDAVFLSPEFSTGNTNSIFFNSIQTDSAGRIVVLGNFTRVNGVARDGLARFLPDGQLDPSFVPAPRTGGGASMLLASDPARLVLLGSDVQYGGINDRRGAVALATPALPATAAPVLVGDVAPLLVPPFRPLALGLPVYAPATAAVQWYRDGVLIPGATQLTYRRPVATAADAGVYHATVTTTGGTVTTPTVQVSVASTDYAGGLSARNGAADVLGVIRRAVRQPDGRILVLSDGAFVDRRGPYQLFRLNADGTFHSGLAATVIDAPTTQTSSSNTSINDMIVDAEGRIYLGGSFTTLGGVTRTRVARLLADGTLDPTWSAAGTGPNSTVQALALLPDGRLMIGGSFSSVAGTSRPYVARLTTSGTLDATFAPVGAGLNSVVNALLVQPSGHVVVGGSFTSYSGITANRLARLDSNGALDATFIGATSNTVHALAALSDGRLALSGAFNQVNGTSRGSPAILSENGALDSTGFTSFSGSTPTVLRVGEGDTLYLVSGANLVRFPGAATEDATFRAAGNTTQRGAFNVQPQSVVPVGDEILYAGPHRTVGTVPSFGLTWLRATAADAGPVIVSPPVGLSLLEGRGATFAVAAIAPSGGISYVWTRVGSSTVLSTTASLSIPSVTLADAGTYRVVVSNGAGLREAFASLTVTPDPASGPGKVRFSFAASPTLGYPQSSQIGPDGLLHVLAVSPNALVRLDPLTGATLSSIPLTPTNGNLSGFAYDSLGRLYVWGQFSAMNGHATCSVARFTSAGVIDPTFVSPLATPTPVDSVVPLPDGRLYVVGNFTVTLPSGGTRTNIVRLLADGAVDTGFEVPANLFLKQLLPLPDGRLLAYNESRLMRLLANGQEDPTFARSSVAGVNTVHRLENGSLLVGHGSQLVDGLNRPGIVRFSADGVIDPSFRLELGSLSFISRFVLRPDGRIVVLGYRVLGSNGSSTVAQFLPDGTPDPAFDLSRQYFSVQSGGNIFQGSPNDFVLLPDGDIVATGGFNRIDSDISRTNLVRLQGTPLAPVIVTPPQSTTVVGGTPVTFSVSVSGTPAFTYQWQRGSTAIPGATAATYTLSPSLVADAGDYRVVVTNAVGSVTSATATLIVTQSAQTITFAPLADVVFSPTPIPLTASASSGLAVTFTVVSGPATINGSALTLTGSGSVTVRATQAGNAAFLAAPPVERTFTATAPLTGFAAWQQGAFTVGELGNALISGPNADPDGDGFSNLVEYALGLAPKTPSTTGLPEVGTTATEWTFTYTRPAARSDVTYVVELSTNLTTWTTTNVTHQLVSTVGGVETWRARVALSAAPNAFFRLKVTR